MEVLIGNKKFHVSLEWHTYADREDAKEKLKEFKEDGYDAVLFKVGDKHQVCVSKKEKLKHPVLATGFFHLLYGYYYMPLEGAVWVLLKGEDGTVIHEGIYKDLESFEAENSERVLPFLGSAKSRQKLSLSDAKDFKKKSSVNPVLLTVPLAVVVVIFGFFFVSKVLFKPKRVAPLPPPQTAPSTVMDLVPSAEEKPRVLSWGRLDLSCYGEFYERALKEGRGGCEWSLSPSEKGKEGLARCDEATEVMRSFSGLKWGEVSDYGDVMGYSFNLSGNFFSEDLRKLEKLSFAELKFSISGELKNFNTTLTGVLLCQR